MSCIYYTSSLGLLYNVPSLNGPRFSTQLPSDEVDGDEIPARYCNPSALRFPAPTGADVMECNDPTVEQEATARAAQEEAQAAAEEEEEPEESDDD